MTDKGGVLVPAESTWNPQRSVYDKMVCTECDLDYAINIGWQRLEGSEPVLEPMKPIDPHTYTNLFVCGVEDGYSVCCTWGTYHAGKHSWE